jgi:hypothetical protein
MSAGRSTRRGYAYIGAPISVRHEEPSNDLGLLVFIAVMIFVIAAALGDPVISTMLARLLALAHL